MNTLTSCNTTFARLSKAVCSFALKPSPGAYSVPALYRRPERVRLESGQSGYGRNSGVHGCRQER